MEKLDGTINLRVGVRGKKKIEDASEKQNLKPAQWMRKVLMDKADKVLREESVV